jgi:hypothetical protein
MSKNNINRGEFISHFFRIQKALITLSERDSEKNTIDKLNKLNLVLKNISDLKAENPNKYSELFYPNYKEFEIDDFLAEGKDDSDFSFYRDYGIYGIPETKKEINKREVESQGINIVFDLYYDIFKENDKLERHQVCVEIITSINEFLQILCTKKQEFPNVDYTIEINELSNFYSRISRLLIEQNKGDRIELLITFYIWFFNVFFIKDFDKKYQTIINKSFIERLVQFKNYSEIIGNVIQNFVIDLNKGYYRTTKTEAYKPILHVFEFNSQSPYSEFLKEEDKHHELFELSSAALFQGEIDYLESEMSILLSRLRTKINNVDMIEKHLEASTFIFRSNLRFNSFLVNILITFTIIDKKFIPLKELITPERNLYSNNNSSIFTTSNPLVFLKFAMISHYIQRDRYHYGSMYQTKNNFRSHELLGLWFSKIYFNHQNHFETWNFTESLNNAKLGLDELRGIKDGLNSIESTLANIEGELKTLFPSYLTIDPIIEKIHSIIEFLDSKINTDFINLDVSSEKVKSFISRVEYHLSELPSLVNVFQRTTTSNLVDQTTFSSPGFRRLLYKDFLMLHPESTITFNEQGFILEINDVINRLIVNQIIQACSNRKRVSLSELNKELEKTPENKLLIGIGLVFGYHVQPDRRDFLHHKISDKSSGLVIEENKSKLYQYSFKNSARKSLIIIDGNDTGKIYLQPDEKGNDVSLEIKSFVNIKNEEAEIYFQQNRQLFPTNEVNFDDNAILIDYLKKRVEFQYWLKPEYIPPKDGKSITYYDIVD